jgi:hypothetical protein
MYLHAARSGGACTAFWRRPYAAGRLFSRSAASDRKCRCIGFPPVMADAIRQPGGPLKRTEVIPDSRERNLFTPLPGGSRLSLERVNLNDFWRWSRIGPTPVS